MFLHRSLLVCALPLVLADSSVRLFHRLYDHSLPDAPFLQRGSLVVSGSGPSARASLASSESLSADLLEFAHAIPDTQNALYQVALERKGAGDQLQWDISSVKACHLPSSTSEEFIVHLTQDGTPFALDYFVGPIPHDGACPKLRRSKFSKSDTTPITGSGSSESSPELWHVQNTTISLVSPRLPPLPTLRVPPPLTPEGKPVEPVPEKTFLQKYWMYIGVAVVALLISPGGEEEKNGAGAADGGGKR